MNSAAGPMAHVALRVFIAKEQKVQRGAQQAWDGVWVSKGGFGGVLCQSNMTVQPWCQGEPAHIAGCSSLLVPTSVTQSLPHVSRGLI